MYILVHIVVCIVVLYIYIFAFPYKHFLSNALVARQFAKVWRFFLKLPSFLPRHGIPLAFFFRFCFADPSTLRYDDTSTHSVTINPNHSLISHSVGSNLDEPVPGLTLDAFLFWWDLDMEETGSVRLSMRPRWLADAGHEYQVCWWMFDHYFMWYILGHHSHETS